MDTGHDPRMTQIAGAHGRNGLTESRRRQRERDNRPLSWWDADGHRAEQQRQADDLDRIHGPGAGNWMRALAATDDD